MSTPKSERTRKAILGSARKLIEANPHTWTMEDVADEADVTRMTVYRYFPSRTALLIETVRHVDAVEGAVDRFQAPHQVAPVDLIETWTHIWADYIPHIAPMAQALLSARGYDAAAARAWEDRMAFLMRGPLYIAQRLESEGTLANGLTVDVAAELMWAFASVQVWEALTNGRGWSTAKYKEHLTRALQRVLAD